jgi:hypothetical protein
MSLECWIEWDQPAKSQRFHLEILSKSTVGLKLTSPERADAFRASKSDHDS